MVLVAASGNKSWECDPSLESYADMSKSGLFGDQKNINNILRSSFRPNKSPHARTLNMVKRIPRHFGECKQLKNSREGRCVTRMF